MIEGPVDLFRRSVGEWTIQSNRAYKEPFIDVRVDAVFTAPSGREYKQPAFFDGDGIWRVRFNPGEAGAWQMKTVSMPQDPDLEGEQAFAVKDHSTAGFLRAAPGRAWGFEDEEGAPVFLLGDTTYNLFGAAHCELDVNGFLERRSGQGFNLLRVRVPVSPFHPPEGYSEWQTRRTWPWGGSEQSPRFDRFNLDYFASVDRVVAKAESLGLGLEMIMEAWGFEFPFNSRHLFTPEWEEVWLRYLVARYDAYNCLYFWTLMNEYEYYPDGDWRYNPLADRWAIRMARWLKDTACHGHIVSIHNGPRTPSFAQRLSADPGAVDHIMFQSWGTTGRENGWLAAGIDQEITAAFDGWAGTSLLSEFGYERNPTLPRIFPGHDFCDVEHMRRAAWRGFFCGQCIITGFEHTWGPFMILDQDQPSLAELQHLHRFATEMVPFHTLRPASELLVDEDYARGYAPLVLADSGGTLVAVYFPAGGEARLALGADSTYSMQWYDTTTGILTDELPADSGDLFRPPADSNTARPQDWVLLLHAGADDAVGKGSGVGDRDLL